MLLNWWKNGLQVKLGMRIYPHGLLIAALYALACWTARKISVDQFYLVAGIRVAALLLCPPRLWPYLLLGEYAYLAQLRYPLIETYGLVWAIVASAIVMPAVALTVRLHERMRAGTSSAWLLSLAAMAAIVAALLSVAAAELLWPAPASIPMQTRAVHQTLGNFIGILTVAPLALLWLQRRDLEWKPLLPIPTIALFSLILVLGFSATLIPPTYAALVTSVRLMMALPAIALTCLHGWRGAALAVPLLYLIVGLTMPTSGRPWSFDSATFTVQQILAIAGCALLALGSTISHYYHRYKARDFYGKQAVSLAKTSHLAGEMDLRQRSMEINRIGDGIDSYLSETADWLKRQGHDEIATKLIRTSSLYSRKFREQASMVYPTTLEHVGLYLALQVGGISEAWSSTGCIAQPRLTGDPCRLPVLLQLAAYRTLTEAVSLLLQNEGKQMRVSARCGRAGNREGILVVVALLESRHRLSDATRKLAVERLSGRALTYGGTVQCRSNRIRMLFLDAPDAQRAALYGAVADSPSVLNCVATSSTGPRSKPWLERKVSSVVITEAGSLERNAPSKRLDRRVAQPEQLGLIPYAINETLMAEYARAYSARYDLPHPRNNEFVPILRVVAQVSSTQSPSVPDRLRTQTGSGTDRPYARSPQ